MSEQYDVDEPAFWAVGLAVAPVPPPAGLRSKILAAAHEPVSAGDQAGRVVSIPSHARPRGTGGVRVPLAAVAAMVAIALLAGLFAGDRFGQANTPAPAPQVAHFTLTGHGSMQGAAATAIDLKQDGIALVSFSGLAAAPPGKLYEVWLITPDNRADPAGIFLPDENGQRLLVIERPLKGYKVMAVTVEAAPSGVASPTSTPELAGTVA